MSGDPITSPSVARVHQHAADARPAWLWSQDGQTLLWHNRSAALFLAKLKKHGLRLAAPAVPIKGQVARNIRLGSPGRTSLARIQFLAGDKPASRTCATTPLAWDDAQTALLIVGVDPIEPEILEADAALRRGPDGIGVDEDGALDEVAVEAQASGPLPAAGAAPEWAQGAPAPEHPVAPAHVEAADDVAYHRELQNWREAEADGASAIVQEPGPAAATPDVQAPLVEPATTQALDAEPAKGEPTGSRLSRLMEQLAADDSLFKPLTDADDSIKVAPAAPDMPAPLLEAETDIDAPGRLDGVDQNLIEVAPPAQPVQTDSAPQQAAASGNSEPDKESVERVSRYNFDELSRILNDRVGDSPALPAPGDEPQRRGALISLGGETLVLNRLPLGILVFRDQQVLFANRAITEMVGYNSVESLRAAGLSAVFPAAGPEGQEAGPVNHLVQRDGTLVPVTARLQSISWQGRPALMLSASATEVRTGHEAAVRAFAQTAAELRGDGFFETTRTGVFSAMTQRASVLLDATGSLEGKPLSTLIAPRQLAGLQAFLERPARFAESERPYLLLQALNGNAEIMLFAQGQAGIITNYFGFVRGRDTAPARLAGTADTDPALLARISRGVRRPLNTILGFAELLRTQAFAGQADKPFEGYAQDIATAGQDIAALVDELDNYARLRDGRYLPHRSSVALTALLESCVLRIRGQANNARVIVRNAIAENLPSVTADRASLEQAVLNLLASAIDQSPTGGAVVISAKLDDEGAIAVHVRDSSSNAVDMAERFVVFRDGVGRAGQKLAPVRSSVGLALTRSLLAVNNFSLSVDPAGERGLLFTLIVPADLVEKPASSSVAE